MNPAEQTNTGRYNKANNADTNSPALVHSIAIMNASRKKLDQGLLRLVQQFFNSREQTTDVLTRQRLAKAISLQSAANPFTEFPPKALFAPPSDAGDQSMIRDRQKTRGRFFRYMLGS